MALGLTIIGSIVLLIIIILFNYVTNLCYVTNSEKRVTDLLKKLKNKNAISEETYNKARPVGSKPDTLYGPAKVHEPLKNRLPPFSHSFSDWHCHIQIGKIFSSRSV